MEQAPVYKARGSWFRLTSNAWAVLDCWLRRVSLEPSAAYNLIQVTLVALVLAPKQHRYLYWWH